MVKKLFVNILYWFLILGFPITLFADFSFSDIENEYIDSLQLTGLQTSAVLNFRSLENSSSTSEIADGPWAGMKTAREIIQGDVLGIRFFYPELFSSYNTERNWGSNDAAVWQGRGFNSSLSTGIKATSEYFSFLFRPQIYFEQNLDFDIVSTTASSGYGDYWTIFDNLQRDGNDPVFGYSWGQSALRINYRGITMGAGTQNYVIGPGRFNNILMGQNAEGFPHIDFGTDGPQEIKHVGNAEARIVWGWLEESEYFDNDSSNDFGWFSGFYAAISPGLIPSLTLGFNHQYYKPMSNWEMMDLIRGIPFLDHTNSPGDTKDMMASLTFEFLFPSVGFEFYGEWARNDNFGSLEDLFKSPEHTQGYTLGLNYKVLENTIGFLTACFELSNLQQERTLEVRAAGPWYRHAWSGWSQGFTNKGQLPGAAIGPGSNSQTFALAWTDPKGKTELTLQRIAHDKDYYYTVSTDPDINIFSEMNCGIGRLHMFSAFQVYGKAVGVLFVNNNFSYKNALVNLHFELGMRYIF